MNNHAMPLRPYLEKVERICKGLKKDELIGLVVRIAGNNPPDTRQQFLDTLRQYLHQGKDTKKPSEPGDEELLRDNLRSLRQSIRERINSIEDGTYWEDTDDEYWEEGYYDNEPECLSESQKTQLAAYFDVAGDYFLQDRLPEARRLYNGLFDLVAEINRYCLMPDIEVDIREAHARYCRAVYEQSAKQDRVAAMLAAMAVKEPDPDFDNIQGRDMALLQDVIDAQVGAMPDLDGFLVQWKKALGKMGCKPDRLARLRLEAAYMLESYDGIARLARSWKRKQPLGYVVWLQHLVEARQWEKVNEAAREVLESLPAGRERRFAAGCLVQAGRQTGNDDLVFAGRKEAFRSSLNENDLLLLMDEANRRNRRNEELAWAIEALNTNKKHVYNPERLLARLYLMSGDITAAAALCKNEKVYGWSGGSPGALFFCAVLYCMAGKRARDCVLLDSMLADYTRSRIYFDSYWHDDEKPGTTFAEEIKKGLDHVETGQESFSKHIPPTLRNGRKRIEYIVSNKYRNAYDRAAAVLGAMAETHIATGNGKEAETLVRNFYFEKFNRFSAFRGEVRNGFAKPPLLKKIRKMLVK